MIKFIVKKILYGVLVLWGVLTLVFFLFQVMPGDSASNMLGQRQDNDQIKKIRKEFGFDKPVLNQYLLYLNDVSLISIHNNYDQNNYTYLDDRKYNFFKVLTFGHQTIVVKSPYLRKSYVKRGKTVSSILSETFPVTMVLAVTSILFAIIFGILFGVIAALYKDGLLDKFLLFISAIGMSLPSFFASIIVAWIFAFLLHDFTGLSMTGSLYEVDDYGRGEYLNLRNLILPAFTLGIRPISVIMQLTRNSMIDVLSQDYIRTAKSKGLSRYIIVLKHALTNALNPVITVVSGWFASMLAGAVFVEYIFGWNGIGKEIVNALNTLDMPVLMGSVLLISTVFLVINILVDIMYSVIDPRVRLK